MCRSRRARIRKSHPWPVFCRRLPELYRACDVLVLPTKEEGWGLPIIEALGVRDPAIATNLQRHTTLLKELTFILIDVERMMVAVNRSHLYGRTAEPTSGSGHKTELDHLRGL